MISTTAIAFIISAFCGIKTTKDLDNPIKADCFDFMNNCVVVYNGETTEELMNQCKETWAKRENELRKELKEKRNYK